MAVSRLSGLGKGLAFHLYRQAGPVIRALGVAALLVWPAIGHAGPPAPTVARGAYLARAAGCADCHTAKTSGSKPFAGGRALKTRFGIFYSPNITPDRATGIGTWSNKDFLRAVKDGIAPGRKYLFPVMPFTSYTKMSDADALAIKAYLFSLPPVAETDKPPQAPPPFAWRALLPIWRQLYFEPQHFRPNPAKSATWNRGAYLVQALAHCGECHTPRNFLGALETSRGLSGTNSGPDGDPVPNITPDRKTGIGSWGIDDVVTLLKTGMTPGFDNVQGSMAEAIENGFRYLTADDLKAIATYVLSQRPIAHKVRDE